MKKIGTRFNNTPLVAEQNNYTRKILNVYNVHDLDYWPKIPLRNFTLKNCFFGATNIAKNIDKEKYVYSGYGIAFDGNLMMTLLEVLIFGVDNSSSSHTDKS